MDTKQVIVVRKDLKKAGWGKLMAQVAHASMAAILQVFNPYVTENLINITCNLYKDTPEFEWLKGSFTKICVWAEDEKHLLSIYNQAYDAGLPCSLIKDNGRTVFKGIPTYTTVGIGPAEVLKVDEITGDLQLI